MLKNTYLTIYQEYLKNLLAFFISSLFSSLNSLLLKLGFLECFLYNLPYLLDYVVGMLYFPHSDSDSKVFHEVSSNSL